MAATVERKRITESTLKGLKPRSAEWFVKDTEQRGFQVKVLPSGLAVYQVEARLGGSGQAKKFKIGNVVDLPLREAREKAREALNDIRSGIDPQSKKKQKLFAGMTFEGLFTDYIERPSNRLKPRTIKNYKNYFDYHFKAWKSKRVVDITKHEIADWYKRGKDAPTYTHSAFRMLKALMNYAIGIEIISVNPCDMVSKSKMAYPVNKRNTFLEPNKDLGKFLKAFIDYKFVKDSQQVARDAIVLMLTTGLRFNEVQTLKFSQVDFDKKLFRLEDTKNRQDHIVPLVPLTYTMFKKRLKSKEKTTDYVFRIKGGETKSPYVTDIRKTLWGICDSAGIANVSSHDLRRTFASALNSVGVGFADMKALMNHKKEEITLMYVQNNLEVLREHLKKVVAYYDSKIVFPENIDDGYEDTVANIIQASLYKNITASPNPLQGIKAEKGYAAHMKDQEDEYWEGDIPTVLTSET